MLSGSAVAAVRPNIVDKAARRSTGSSIEQHVPVVPKAQHTQTLNPKILPFHQLVVLKMQHTLTLTLTANIFRK